MKHFTARQSCYKKNATWAKQCDDAVSTRTFNKVLYFLLNAACPSFDFLEIGVLCRKQQTAQIWTERQEYRVLLVESSIWELSDIISLCEIQKVTVLACYVSLIKTIVSLASAWSSMTVNVSVFMKQEVYSYCTWFPFRIIT